MKPALLAISIAALLGCGGSQKTDNNDNDEGLGQSTNSGANTSNDPDVDKGDGAGDATGDSGSQPDPNEIKKPPPPEGPAFTFVLKNAHDEDLSFNMDHGWGGNIFAYTVDPPPPKARVVVPFEKFCTAECSAAQKCLKCTQPEKLGKIKEAQKIETVKPGEELKVEWDAIHHNYEKVKKGCECFKKEEVQPDTYTVRACGLWLTKSAKKRTMPECVEQQITIPAEGPQTVEFEFTGPPSKKKKKAKAKKPKKKG